MADTEADTIGKADTEADTIGKADTEADTNARGRYGGRYEIQ
jgi:hypothetical protein